MAPRRKLLPTVFFLLPALLLSCAGTPMILRNGVEMPLEQAAKLDYGEGEAFFAKKRYKEASARFRSIVDQMPISSLADNAMLRLAQIFRIQNNPGNAIRILEALLAKYPTSDATLSAKEELGKLLIAQKDFRRAAEIFASIPWKEVPPRSRPSLEKVVRSAFEQAQAERVELFWLISVWDTATDPAKLASLQVEIVELLDRATTRNDLEEIYRTREPKFPAGHACFKLAKIAHHSGNLKEAKEWVTTFLNRFPEHEVARDAVLLSESLIRTEEADPLSVGLLLPLTGSNQVFAFQVLRGVVLAMDLFGPKKPDAPLVSFHIEDVGDDPEKAAAAVEKLVREKRIVAALGPLFSKESQAAATAALQYGLPILTLTPVEGITEIGENVFRNSLTKSEQAAELARLAIDTLGIRRAAILYPQNSYGTEFMTLFWNEFVRLGGEIRGAESYDPLVSDFGRPIKRLVALSPLELRPGEVCSEEEMNKRLKEALTGKKLPRCYPPDKLPPLVDFEAVFVPDGFEKVTQIVPALAFYDVRGVQILGSNLLNSPDIFRARAGEAMQGAIFLDGFFKDKKDPQVSQFVQRFYATFGSEPGVLEAQAFDTASIVLNVISKNRPSNRRGFVEALRNVKEFPGVSGETSFSPSRDARRKLTTLTVDGEQIVELN